MERTQLSLEHADIINKRLNTLGMHLSEFSFPNLYLFRHTHQYELIHQDSDNFFISGLTYDRKKYLMPMCKPSVEADCDLKEMLQTDEWDFIFPVPAEWLDCFPSDYYNRTFSQDDSDYLYLTEKFKTYPGKKMHKKKNLMNQFIRNHSIEAQPMEDSNIDKAIQILDVWQKTTPQELTTSDYHQCLEAINLKQTLGLTGFVILADGNPAAFLLSEPLNNDTYTIHFAKANISYKGVYQYMFSHIANHYCSNYLYMNQEQDMGKEGLRKTKRSYRPDLMAHKYRISIKT